jgi:protein-L-isoaspartate(D-aspartate) O-methyltransferase
MEDNYIQKRELMVFLQLKSRGIDSDNIINAFLHIPRENFVTPENTINAYEDKALPLFNNQTISQPYIVGLMTKMLNPSLNQTILEIGSGSGYQSAILSQLCKKVISYEIDKELSEFANQNLKKTKISNITIINADASDNIKQKDFFDGAIITAATNKIPQSITSSLKEGATLIVPQGTTFQYQILKKYIKKNKELQLVESSIAVNFVPLRGKHGFINN